jgi:hypothetical protein
MELCVQLKVCEGCGCLWYRAQEHSSVYCKRCETKLTNFPTPETRKLPGPMRRRPRIKVWAVAEAMGGAE